MKAMAAALAQWMLRWADRSLSAAVVTADLAMAQAECARLQALTVTAQQDQQQTYAALLQLRGVCAAERFGRVAAETLLATLRAENAARDERELLEATDREQQRTQRLADLDVYRAYLYSLMPEVCKRSGLDPSLIDPAWPLWTTGKLNDVLVHLGALDQRGHVMPTLGDVIEAFVGAAH